jgi:integrase
MAFERKRKDPETGKKIRTGKYYTDFYERNATGELILKDGKAVRVRKFLPGCKSLKEANEIERGMMRARRSTEEERPRELTFGEFTHEHFRPYAEEQYANPAYMRTVLGRLEDFMGEIPLKSISEFTVVNYMKKRQGDTTERGGPPKNSSINTEVFGILSAVLTKAVTTGRIKSNPCHEVTELEEDPDACPRLEDEDALLQACLPGPAWLMPLVIFFLGTGLRRNEGLNLKWSEVDLARQILYVLKPKWRKDPRKDKGLPFGERVLEVLQSLPRRGEYVFTTDRGRDVPGTTFYTEFKAACERAGIYFKPHWLRHEYGSRLGDLNTNPYKIARLMGHATVKMSMRYVHAKDDDLRVAVEGVFSQSGHSAVSQEGARVLRSA